MELEFAVDPALEAETVAALRSAVGWDQRLENIRQAAGKSYLTAACFAGELLVGYVEVISDRVDDAYIRNLMVHPGCRRRGIALKLLEMVTDRIKADGIKMANVLFEPELAPLYRKAGFAIVAGGLIDNET
jgi:ribosomal protein S18 acetylase RimI-like enzyme